MVTIPSVPVAVLVAVPVPGDVTVVGGGGGKGEVGGTTTPGVNTGTVPSVPVFVLVPVSVHGSVTVEVPASLGAEVELSSVTGRVETEFPVTLTGRIDPRRLRATIGDGSRHVRLRTVNGNVDLRRSS